LLGAVADLLIQLEQDPTNKEIVNAIFRPVHSIKGNAAFFGFHRLREFAHELESLLVLIREGKRQVTRPLLDVTLAGVEELQSTIHRLQSGGAEVANEASFRALLERIVAAQKGDATPRMESTENFTQLRQALTQRAPDLLPLLDGMVAEDSQSVAAVSAPASDAKGPVAAAAKAADPKPSSRHENTKFMRVREEDVDMFLSFVGEILTIGEALTYVERKLIEGSDPEQTRKHLRETNREFSKVSLALQSSVMAIRRVPVKPLIQKLPKIARDVATAREKDVRVSITGDDLLIDKSVIEVIDAPLVHIVRNAVDHGIESPGVRASRGKEKTGSVRIELAETSKDLVVQIHDDGNGIPLEKLRAKAIEAGMITANQPLGEEELVSLIFSAGMSTAEQVTDISGRGVGMDVVKRSLESAGGKISIETTAEKGSSFKIVVPKTASTQIILGMITQCHDQTYVLPAERVRETFYCTHDSFSNVPGLGRCVYHQGEHLPVVDLSEIFYGERSSGACRVAISTKVRGIPCAIVVDQVDAVHHVVIKKLSQASIFDPCFAGASILGDGSLALVVDLDNLDATVESPSQPDEHAPAEIPLQ
ncbi:MAG: chemotaxis protein CheW, partial [Deltaproteobacteria bacterium]|nr:chemotaxis protein CheW [Deltaproteobacteria bacterium]